MLVTNFGIIVTGLAEGGDIPFTTSRITCSELVAYSRSDCCYTNSGLHVGESRDESGGKSCHNGFDI